MDICPGGVALLSGPEFGQCILRYRALRPPKCPSPQGRPIHIVAPRLTWHLGVLAVVVSIALPRWSRMFRADRGLMKTTTPRLAASDSFLSTSAMGALGTGGWYASQIPALLGRVMSTTVWCRPYVPMLWCRHG